jgi:hypothetical protein
MAFTYQLIASTTLVSTSSTITFSSIPQTFTDLKITMSARGSGNETADSNCWLRVNGISTGSIYWLNRFQYIDSGITTGTFTSSADQLYLDRGPVTGALAPANTFSNADILMPSYTNSFSKSIFINGTCETQTDATATFGTCQNSDFINMSAGISSITFGGTTYQVGTTIRLYGIKNL